MEPPQSATNAQVGNIMPKPQTQTSLFFLTLPFHLSLLIVAALFCKSSPLVKVDKTYTTFIDLEVWLHPKGCNHTFYFTQPSKKIFSDC